MISFTPSSRSYIRPFFWLVLLTAALGTITTGEIPLATVIQTIGNGSWNALLDERLPRLLVLLMTGASLAVSGAVMQALFQNELASPGILGVTPAGSLMVMIALTTGLQHDYPLIWPLAAVIGSLGALLIVYGLARREGAVQMHQVVLTGIAISTLIITVQGILIYLLRDQWQLVLTITEWEAGSTLNRSWDHVHMQLPLTLVGLFGCLHYRHDLDRLALGEEEALNLGVDVPKIRWRLFLCVALLTGGAIAAIGMIAFFGLLLPHLLRLISGPQNSTLIPLCSLAGAALLTSLDLMLRLLHIYAVTIGNVSAILGGIFFLILLFGKRYRRQLC